jgi:hypothetical protein
LFDKPHEIYAILLVRYLKSDKRKLQELADGTFARMPIVNPSATGHKIIDKAYNILGVFDDIHL